MQKRFIKNSESKDFIREYFKQWPQFYLFIAKVFGPVYFTGLSSYAFIKRFFPIVDESKVLINIGAGTVRLRADIKNYDITRYGLVDVVADIKNLPLKTNEVDGFVCDNVLEHVNQPHVAVQELFRVLKPGGVGYISTPFMYPFHSSPSDYQRWTIQGLCELCNEFEIVEQGVRGGPFSALNTYLCHVTGILLSFGIPSLYSFFVNASMLVFWPIKLLDIVFAHVPNAVDVSAVLYIVVRKR